MWASQEEYKMRPPTSTQELSEKKNPYYDLPIYNGYPKNIYVRSSSQVFKSLNDVFFFQYSDVASNASIPRSM
jgi:hypothetical protein